MKQDRILTEDRQNGADEKSERPASSARTLDADTLKRALQDSYKSTVDEGVPDEFLDLINKLK